MGDLVEWLREQLDEDDRIARGTGQPGTSWQGLEMDGELRDDANAGTVAYIPRAETRAHIARHDPARVLRETEAKRRTIALCEPPLVDVTGPQDTERQFIPGEGPPWGLDVLKLLALPYADRPGYRDDWRP